MDKHKLNENTPAPPSDSGRAPAVINADGIIAISMIGRMTGQVITGLINNLKPIISSQRQAGKPVNMLIDISQIKGHDSASRIAGKQAAGLDFDRGAAFGGSMAQGLVMQYLQRSINPSRARYFRTRSAAMAWLTSGDIGDTPKPVRQVAPISIILSVIALVAASLATHNAWTRAQAEVRKEASANLAQQVGSLQANVQKRLLAYTQSLHGFRGLYVASNAVERKEFQDYFKTLDINSQFPGLAGISFARRVLRSEKAAYTAQVRKDTSLNPKGYPNFKIFPDSLNAEYAAVTYVQPVGDDSSLGFDLLSDPARQKALLTGRDSGQATATSTLKLLRSGDLGFFITLPIYGHTIPTSLADRRQQLQGYISAIMRYEPFFTAALDLSKTNPLKISVKDAAGATVFAVDNTEGAAGQTLTRPLTVAGQEFTIDYSASDSYGLSLATRDLPLLILSSGATTVILLLIVLISLIRSRSQAINLANIMTEDLEQERNLAIANQKKLEQTEAALIREKASVEQKVVDRTRELKEAHAQLMASVSGLPFGFAVIDGHDRILFANSELARLVGRDIPDDPVQTHQVLSQIARQYASELDLMSIIHTAQTSLGSIERVVSLGPKYFRFFVMPITLPRESSAQDASQVIGGVLIIEDVSEEKNLQRSKDEFFSIASHELRTPVTAIRGNLSLMTDLYPDQFKQPALRQMIADASDASHRLATIVSDFLDMSRLEQGQVKFQTEVVDLVPVIKQIGREYEAIATQQKLTLKLELPKQPCPALIDTNRFHQILSNLLSNALHHTQKGSITISLVAAGEVVKVSVTDTGQGILEQYQSLLFHKFQQATPDILTRDSSRSTGLGLYIASLLAGGMNGRLYLESSQPDKGSRFTMEIPSAHD